MAIPRTGVARRAASTCLLIASSLGGGWAADITGLVTDALGKPLAGAKVHPVGDTARAVLTDAQGRFRLSLPTGLSGRRREGGPRLPIGNAGLLGRTLTDPEARASVRDGAGRLAEAPILGWGWRSVRVTPPDPGAPADRGAAKAAAAALRVERRYYRSRTVEASEGADLRIALDKLPNVLLILSDDQAWTDYGFMGHPEIRTPNLDRLASQGLLFTRGYGTSSLCRPGLMTFATGRHPFQHGITGNDTVPGMPRESLLVHIDRAVTFWDLLRKERGYISLQTGKWWEGSWQRGRFTQGMTTGSRHGDEGLSIGRAGMGPIPAFLDSAGERPFFLWYAPMLPHTPHNPPARILDKYLPRTPSPYLARYWAMVEWFDETCGQVLKLLDDRGLRENTLVLFASDNGWIQLPDRADADYARSKRSPYDMGIRAPLIVSWPARLQPLRDTASLASTIDFAPTILAAADLPPGTGMGGASLLDSGKAVRARGQVYGDIYEHDQPAVHDPLPGLRYRWTVEGRWKLILPAARIGGAALLFDVVKDPHEKADLAGTNPAVAARLKGEIEAWYRPGP